MSILLFHLVNFSGSKRTASRSVNESTSQSLKQVEMNETYVSTNEDFIRSIVKQGIRSSHITKIADETRDIGNTQDDSINDLSYMKLNDLSILSSELEVK